MYVVDCMSFRGPEETWRQLTRNLPSSTTRLPLSRDPRSTRSRLSVSRPTFGKAAANGKVAALQGRRKHGTSALPVPYSFKRSGARVWCQGRHTARVRWCLSSTPRRRYSSFAGQPIRYVFAHFSRARTGSILSSNGGNGREPYPGDGRRAGSTPATKAKLSGQGSKSSPRPRETLTLANRQARIAAVCFYHLLAKMLSLLQSYYAGDVVCFFLLVPGSVAARRKDHL